jgi:hypothetical protein
MIAVFLENVIRGSRKAQVQEKLRMKQGLYEEKIRTFPTFGLRQGALDLKFEEWDHVSLRQIIFWTLKARKPDFRQDDWPAETPLLTCIDLQWKRDPDADKLYVCAVAPQMYDEARAAMDDLYPFVKAYVQHNWGTRGAACLERIFTDDCIMLNAHKVYDPKTKAVASLQDAFYEEIAGSAEDWMDKTLVEAFAKQVNLEGVPCQLPGKDLGMSSNVSWDTMTTQQFIDQQLNRNAGPPVPSGFQNTGGINRGQAASGAGPPTLQQSNSTQSGRDSSPTQMTRQAGGSTRATGNR